MGRYALEVRRDGSGLGWAAGESDTLLRTADSGASWIATVTGQGPRYTWFAASFASATRGWLAGSFGLVRACYSATAKQWPKPSGCADRASSFYQGCFS